MIIYEHVVVVSVDGAHANSCQVGFRLDRGDAVIQSFYKDRSVRRPTVRDLVVLLLHSASVEQSSTGSRQIIVHEHLVRTSCRRRLGWGLLPGSSCARREHRAKRLTSLHTLQWVQELPLRDDPSPTAVCRELDENVSMTVTVLLSDAMDTIYLLDRERRDDGHILIHSLRHQGDHVFVRRLRQTRQTNRVPSRILLEIVLLLFEDGDLFLERIDLCLSLLHNSSQSRQLSVERSKLIV